MQHPCSTQISPRNNVSKLNQSKKRVMRIIYGDITYTEALQKSRIPSLEERRETLTKNFFRYIQRKDDKLNKLLSPETNNSHDTRKRYKYKLPQCKTSRFRNSFIPYCLFKFQWTWLQHLVNDFAFEWMIIHDKNTISHVSISIIVIQQ